MKLIKQGERQKFVELVEQLCCCYSQFKQRDVELPTMKVIIELLKKNVEHQPRRNVLLEAINSFLDKNIFDVNTILVELAKSLELISFPQLWPQICSIIQTNLSRISILSAEQILHEILQKLQTAPLTISPAKEDLSMSCHVFPPTSLQYFDSAQCGVRLLCRYYQEETILPPYLLISITQQTIATNGMLPKRHWILQPFIDVVMQHKQNLANLLIPSGRFERYRLPSVYRETLVAQAKVLPSNTIIDNSTASVEREGQDNEMWRQGVRTVASMLYDQVPIKAILFKVLTTEFETIPSRETTPHRSELLLDATVLRAEQLVAFTEHKMNALDPKIIQSLFLEDIYEAWWGEWHRFGFQLYTLVEEHAIDIEGFILKIADKKLQDNGLIWLLCQCLMIERLKEYFMNDIIHRDGWITSKVLSLRNDYHSKTSIPIRDTAVQCFIYRVRALLNEEKNFSQFLVNAAIPPSLQVNDQDLMNRRQWWMKQKDEEPRNPGVSVINFYQPGDDQISICLLSNLSSEPIAKQMHSFFKTDTKGQFRQSDLKFAGHTKPLSIYLLSCLSIKANQRLLYNIETEMFDGAKKTFKKSPGLVETYVRLLSSSLESRYKLQYNLRKADTTDEKRHLLIEMINFRLMRYFRFNQATNRLLIDLHATLMNTMHYQLYNAAENLFIKAALYQTELSTFQANIPVLDFGITGNRLFFFTMARTIKLRGVPDYFTLEVKIPPLCCQMLRHTGTAVWERRSCFFPNRIQYIIAHDTPPLPPKMPVVSKQSIIAYTSSLCSNPSTPDTIQMSAFLPASIFVLHRIKQEQNHRNLMQWLDAGKKELSKLDPRTRAQLTYDFVDFLLDECMKSNESKENYGLSTIAGFGKSLETLIWRCNCIFFERILWALLDRCNDDRNAVSVLEYFLTVSVDTQRVVNDFLHQQIDPQSWKETDYFSKMHEHLQRKDEVDQFTNGGDQPVFPVYYGALPLRLLPILDCAIMTFIESGRTSIISDMLAEGNGKELQAPKVNISYVSLYRYHEGPVIFVKELFHYYYHSIHLTASCKRDILSLVGCNPSVSLSGELDQLRSALTQTGDFTENARELVYRCTTKVLASATNSSHSHHTQANAQFHSYMEFPTYADRMLSLCVIEILLFDPIYIPQLVYSILRPFLSFPSGVPSLCQQEPNSLPFTQLHAMGLLLASLPSSFSTKDPQKDKMFFVSPLPQPFAVVLFKHCFDVLSQGNLFGSTFASGSSNPFATFGYVDSGSKMDPILTEKTNAMVIIMHSFFTHSGIDTLNLFLELFDAWLPGDEMTPCMASYHQLYILCRIVAPWIYRISRSANALCKLIYLILRSLCNVDKQNRASLFLVQCDIAESSANSNSIDWIQGVVIDFLFHLNSLNSTVMSSPQHQVNVASVICELSTQVRSKFDCFFQR